MIFPPAVFCMHAAPAGRPPAYESKPICSLKIRLFSCLKIYPDEMRNILAAIGISQAPCSIPRIWTLLKQSPDHNLLHAEKAVETS